MEARPQISIPRRFHDIQDVSDGLNALEAAFVKTKDRRGVFVSAYVEINRVLYDWIARDQFLQNIVVTRYLVAFANAYRDALVHDELGEPQMVPRAWRQAFAATRRRDTSIVQDLLLGINAHINHDLPHAVIASGMNVDCERSYQDHKRINAALRLATPLVRRRIADNYSRGLHITNVLYGPSIDAQVGNSFERARENCWNLATTLDRAQGTADQECVERMIEDRAASAGQVILRQRHAPARALAVLHEVKMPVAPAAHVFRHLHSHELCPSIFG